MNERIKELAEQATTVVEGWSDESGTTRYYEFNKEKFAELIVWECVVGIANDTANYPGDYMMAYYQGVQDAIKSIRKHFGVEE